MPTFDVWAYILKPLAEKLQADPRFGGVKIFYDRSADRAVMHAEMPAINFFLEAPWEDLSRGSGSFSLQRRQLTARVGIAIWVAGTDWAQLDEALFQISADLLDFLYAQRDFDRSNGVAINSPIRWDVDYSGDEGTLVGTQKLSVEFEMIS